MSHQLHTLAELLAIADQYPGFWPLAVGGMWELTVPVNGKQVSYRARRVG